MAFRLNIDTAYVKIVQICPAFWRRRQQNAEAPLLVYRLLIGHGSEKLVDNARQSWSYHTHDVYDWSLDSANGTSSLYM